MSGMDKLRSLTLRVPMFWRCDNDPTSVQNSRRLLDTMRCFADATSKFRVAEHPAHLHQEVLDAIAFVDKFLIPYQRQRERRRVHKRYR